MVRTMKFVLKHYDSKRLFFDLQSEGLDGFVCMRGGVAIDRQRKRLLKLANFRFTRDCNYNLPAWRLKRLEAFIKQRIRTA